jgi:hypothetical protein
MSITQTSRTYALTEFTSSTPETVNVGIFAQELEDDGYVVEKPSSVYRSGTSVVVEWASTVVSQDTFDAVDAAVAAHVGGAYANIPITEISEGESSTDATTYQSKVTLDSGLLPAGQYLLGWYCEIKTQGTVSNTAVQAVLEVAKNGGAPVERGENTWPYPQYNDFSGSFPFTATDGESYEMTLLYKRLGASSNPAYIKRARLYILRVSD